MDQHMTVTNDRFTIEFLFDTVDQEWVHIAEVVFVNTEISKLKPSPTETTPSVRIPFLQDIFTLSSTPDMSTSSIPSNNDTTINHTSVTLATSTHITGIRLDSTTFTNGNHRIIVASVASGCTTVVLLIVASTLASVCIIIRKSRQSCSSEEYAPQPSKHTKCSKCGYIVDSSLEHGALVHNEAYGTKSDLNLTMHMYVPNNYDVSRESANIYQEIQSSNVTQIEDMAMVQNVAYAVTNRQVICVDNVAYACTRSQQYAHKRCDKCEYM